MVTYNEGDKVRVTTKGLQAHSRKTPPNVAYTAQQADWRKLLSRYCDSHTIGEVIYTWPSGHVNVTFPDGNTMGMDSYLLEKVKP